MALSLSVLKYMIYSLPEVQDFARTSQVAAKVIAVSMTLFTNLIDHKI
jgi:hypothetical protein